MSKHFDVEYYGTDLQVEFDEEMEVVKILHKGEDITEMMSYMYDCALERFQEHAHEQLRENGRLDREDHIADLIEEKKWERT